MPLSNSKCFSYQRQCLCLFIDYMDSTRPTTGWSLWNADNNKKEWFKRLGTGACFQMIRHQLQTNPFQRVLNALSTVHTAQFQPLSGHQMSWSLFRKQDWFMWSSYSPVPVHLQGNSILIFHVCRALCSLWGNLTHIPCLSSTAILWYRERASSTTLHGSKNWGHCDFWCLQINTTKDQKKTRNWWETYEGYIKENLLNLPHQSTS